MTPVPSSAAAADPGRRHEEALAAEGVRKAMGSYYTPVEIVEVVLDLSLDPILRARDPLGVDAVAAIRVLDPACGSGNFLVSAARRIAAALERLGVRAAEASAIAAGQCVAGVDVDAEAVRLCGDALVEAAGREADPSAIRRNVRHGDALMDPSLTVVGRPDLVVGNPPFLSPLARATARSTEAAAVLRRRFGPVVSAYTDPAALFLALAVELARPDGGVVAMVEPISLLSSRDAAGVRGAALASAALRELWVVEDRVFDADVEVCVPVLERGGRHQRVELHRGRAGAPARSASPPPPGQASWSPLLAALSGVPTRTPVVAGTLGDIASATADFRDQYYGLAPHVVDRPEGPDDQWPPLVTVGLIDPATLRWGHRVTRFNKVSYLHPRVHRSALDGGLDGWATSRLVPKVLLATQTRGLEAVADPAGRLLPSVPVVTVVPDVGALWRVAAVLTSPAATATAVERHLGSGRNARSLRLRARDVLALPLPTDTHAWDEAAALLQHDHEAGGGRDGTDRAGLLGSVGTAMNQAYGLGDDPELLHWWLERMPTAPTGRRAAPARR